MTTTIGDYTLVEQGGLWFLLDRDRHIVSTLVDQGAGTWRAVTLDGGATTLTVPDDVDDPAIYVAKQITESPSA
jgi:hypothetical protein